MGVASHILVYDSPSPSPQVIRRWHASESVSDELLHEHIICQAELHCAVVVATTWQDFLRGRGVLWLIDMSPR